MIFSWGFLGGSDDKESACNAGDLGSIPGLGRSPGKGNGYLFQYSCPENSMERGAWRATVHGVAQSQTQLKGLSMHARMYTCVFFTDTTSTILYKQFSTWLCSLSMVKGAVYQFHTGPPFHKSPRSSCHVPGAVMPREAAV